MDDRVTSTMTIGDFSRATRLSAKALRFYHQAGLLEPASVDPANGYRIYTVDQIADAQVIRHYRSLEMSVELIREVLAAPSIEDRNALIAAHLSRMEAQLQQTRSAVAALPVLLTPPDPPLAVSYRSVPETAALVIRQTIDLADLGAWYTNATAELEHVISTTGSRAAGPRGGIWDTELFLDERGTAALFIPVLSFTGHQLLGRVKPELLAPVDLAVATHHGTDETLAQVYGALGAYVTTHALSVDGPIREFYLEPAGDDGRAVTEIGWPIFRTGQ